MTRESCLGRTIYLIGGGSTMHREAFTLFLHKVKDKQYYHPNKRI